MYVVVVPYRKGTTTHEVKLHTTKYYYNTSVQQYTRTYKRTHTHVGRASIEQENRAVDVEIGYVPGVMIRSSSTSPNAEQSTSLTSTPNAN